MPRCFMAKKLKYPYQQWKARRSLEEEEEEVERVPGRGDGVDLIKEEYVSDELEPGCPVASGLHRPVGGWRRNIGRRGRLSSSSSSSSSSLSYLNFRPGNGRPDSPPDSHGGGLSEEEEPEDLTIKREEEDEEDEEDEVEDTRSGAATVKGEDGEEVEAGLFRPYCLKDPVEYNYTKLTPSLAAGLNAEGGLRLASAATLTTPPCHITVPASSCYLQYRNLEDLSTAQAILDLSSPHRVLQQPPSTSNSPPSSDYSVTSLGLSPAKSSSSTTNSTTSSSSSACSSFYLLGTDPGSVSPPATPPDSHNHQHHHQLPSLTTPQPRYHLLQTGEGLLHRPPASVTSSSSSSSSSSNSTPVSPTTATIASALPLTTTIALSDPDVETDLISGAPIFRLNGGKTTAYTYEAFFASDGRSKKNQSSGLSGSPGRREGSAVLTPPKTPATGHQLHHHKLPDPGGRQPVAQQTGTPAQPTVCAAKPKYTCTECGKNYATSSNLSRHRQTHRALDSTNAKQCPVCHKMYVSMPALSMHVLTHNLNHRCDICGKAFSRPWLLQGHLRSHTGDKPYGCAHCGKSFADRSNLRAHMQTHSAFKHYKCKRCAKSFALKSYLNKHHESACFKEGTAPTLTSTTSDEEMTTGPTGASTPGPSSSSSVVDTPPTTPAPSEGSSSGGPSSPSAFSSSSSSSSSSTSSLSPSTVSVSSPVNGGHIIHIPTPLFPYSHQLIKV